MNEINIFSAFDGYSTIMLACKNLNIPVSNYYASEIDPHVIQISKKNHPEIKHIGDIRNINGHNLWYITHAFFGSPCQNVSNAGKKEGFSTSDGIQITSLDQYLTLKKEGYTFKGQSYLYWEILRVKSEINDIRSILGLPDVIFLMENVRMDKKWEDIVSTSLGVSPVRINASLVSCQNRDRNFWTNIPGLTVPEDLHITLNDVISDAVTGYGVRGVKRKGDINYIPTKTARKDNKSNCLTKAGWGISKKTGQPYGNGLYLNTKGHVIPLSPEQAELIQGLPVGYTNGVSPNKRKEMIGNGMSVQVMTHILSHIFNLNTVHSF